MPSRTFAIFVLFVTAGCDGTTDSATVAAGDSDTTETPDTDTVVVGGETIAPIDLCINEFVAQSDESWEDDTGAFPDWIEIHNPTATEISLGDYILTDDPDDPGDETLDASLVVPAGGFLVLAADGEPDLGPTHLPFSLDGEGEGIGLFHTSGAGEILTFGVVETDYSWARGPDCCAEIPDCVTQVWQGTPNATNGDVQ